MKKISIYVGDDLYDSLKWYKENNFHDRYSWTDLFIVYFHHLFEEDFPKLENSVQGHKEIEKLRELLYQRWIDAMAK